MSAWIAEDEADLERFHSHPTGVKKKLERFV
jgi:hypothetical protein